MKQTLHILLAIGALTVLIQTAAPGRQIDRRALVTRHNVTLNKPDPLTPLSVGNGEFAFTADITGLQTFPEYYQQGMPLGTQSQWGWHTLPNPQGYKLADILEDYPVAGRSVPYASDKGYSGDYSAAASWLRANPHRLHLGQIGLRLTKSDGSPAGIKDLTNTSQTLDLWTGLLSSRFDFDGQPVEVLTVCHPSRDLLAVRVKSPLLTSASSSALSSLPKGSVEPVQNRLLVSLAFPYGSAEWRNAADWGHPERHTTQQHITGNQADLTRILDADRYYVRIVWSAQGAIRAKSQHEYEIYAQPDGGPNGQPLEIVFAFSPTEISRAAARFSGSSDCGGPALAAVLE